MMTNALELSTYLLTSSGQWTASMAPVSRVPSVDDPGNQSVRWEAPQVLVT